MLCAKSLIWLFDQENDWLYKYYRIFNSLTCEEEEDEDHNQCVPKVQESAGCANNL